MHVNFQEIADECPSRYSEHRIDLEKFAELIVRKCASIVNQNDSEGSNLGDRLLYPNFGIECKPENTHRTINSEASRLPQQHPGQGQHRP